MAAEAAVSFAVETLGNLLIEKIVFLKGVERGVKWLRDELKRMQCFLKDATKKQSDSDSIRNWISEVREVAHDAQDAIEIFVLNVESRGLLERITCFPSHVYHLHKVGGEIESIRKRLKDIEESRIRYGVQDLGDHQKVESRSQLEVESRRRLAYWQKDTHVVGLRKDVEVVLGKAIFDKSEGLSVAAILGMGGIGKSTLASKIYNHPAVAGRFGFRAWVVVSSDFTAEDIMKQVLLKLGISLDVLELLDSIQDKLARRENLKKELHARLTGKRFFIVLDDVWEATHWESLSSAFPHEDKASRLLLTSRNQVMTRYSRYVHNMKVLDDNESWELFLRKAFVDNTGGRCPEELKNIGEEILKKCGGLPLAISVVGGLLAKKRRCTSEWEKVLKEMKSHLDRNEDISAMSAILELSYQNLPTELKACFLCLGFFKEDAIIEVEDLEQIWIAHGLVQQENVGDKETMENVATEYLYELISRNMVQVKVIEYDNVKFCHIHDLFHDMSIRKAKEEIDLEVVDSHQSLDKPRHRAIHFSEQSFLYSTGRNQHLRSLFIHGNIEASYVGPSSYWRSFGLLRVLDFGNARLQVLPKAVGVLIGLRYFKMRYYGNISRLPRSWGKLRNLEVLDLRCYGTFIIIDKVILKMERLRHLYSDISYSEVPLGNMRNLQTLNLFRVKDSNLSQIQGMARVSLLAFDMREMTDAGKLFPYLTRLENLESLILIHYVKDIITEGLGALHRITRLYLHDLRLPRNFPPNVRYLTLSKLWVTEDLIPVLEKLPELLYLKLSDSFDGKAMVISCRGFPKLRVLHLESMYELTNIEIGEGAMTELNQFIIRGCTNLKVENLPEPLKFAITDVDY